MGSRARSIVRMIVVAQNFMACALSFLVREKRARMYSLMKGVLSAFKFLTSASSIDFYSAVRSGDRVFFWFSLNMSLPLDLADLSLNVASVTLETSAP